MNENTQEREPLKWEDVKTFEEDGNIVRVQRLPLRNPKYSISVGRLNKDGKLIPHIPVQVEGMGKVTVRHSYAKVGLLIQKAEEWVAEEVQRREDERIAYKQAYEMRDADRDRPQTRHTGKTARVREQRKSAS